MANLHIVADEVTGTDTEYRMKFRLPYEPMPPVLLTCLVSRPTTLEEDLWRAKKALAFLGVHPANVMHMGGYHLRNHDGVVVIRGRRRRI